MGDYILAVVVVFMLISIFIVGYGRRVADAAITDQFRAAESISKGIFPEKWRRQITRHLALRKVIPGFTAKKSGVQQALDKMDRLIQYFERSPFFENAATRELLLTQLKDTRMRWSKMTWEEIGKES